jgi:hypothetical protein
VLVEVVTPQEVVEDHQLAQFRPGPGREERRQPGQRPRRVVAGQEAVELGVVLVGVVAGVVERPVDDHLPVVPLGLERLLGQLADDVAPPTAPSPDEGVDQEQLMAVLDAHRVDRSWRTLRIRLPALS